MIYLFYIDYIFIIYLLYIIVIFICGFILNFKCKIKSIWRFLAMCWFFFSYAFLNISFLKHLCSFYVVWKECFPDESAKLFHWSFYPVTVQCLLICCFCECKVAKQKLIFISHYRSFKRTYSSDKKSRKSWSCFDMEPSHSWRTKWIYPKLYHTLQNYWWKWNRY